MGAPYPASVHIADAASHGSMSGTVVGSGAGTNVGGADHAGPIVGVIKGGTGVMVGVGVVGVTVAGLTFVSRGVTDGVARGVGRTTRTVGIGVGVSIGGESGKVRLTHKTANIKMARAHKAR